MAGCRNCGSQDLLELGFVGKIAPFFLKRVFQIRMQVPVSPVFHKELLRRIGRPARRFFSKLYSNEAYLEMELCRSCSFIQARYPFPEEWIHRLYQDYRSESYNRERISYEPTYAGIAARVGADPLEVSKRQEAATKFLDGKMAMGEDFTMLDYGGADGRFLPPLAAQRLVFEISNIEPVEGVGRIATEEELGLYSYIHLAHVLEHVVQPLELTGRVVKHLKPGGYLYVEVPQETTDDELRRVRAGTLRREITVHEHINQYSREAVTKLMEAVGLELVAIEAEAVDIGWARGTHLRALARKG